MSKGVYIGVDDLAHKVKKMYIGVNNVSRKIIKGYIGDANNKARLFWSGGGGDCFVMVNDGKQSIVFSIDSGKTWDSVSIASSIGDFRPSVYYKGLFIGYASKSGVGGIYYISKENIIAKGAPTLGVSLADSNKNSFYDGRFILKGNTLEFICAIHYTSDGENVYTLEAYDSSDGRTWTDTGVWSTKNFNNYPHIEIRHTTYFQNRYISLYAVNSYSGSRFIYYSAENANFPQCLSSMTMSSSYVTEGSPDFFETPTKILGAGLKKTTRYLVEYSNYDRGITKSSTAPAISNNNLTISGGIPFYNQWSNIMYKNFTSSKSGKYYWLYAESSSKIGLYVSNSFDGAHTLITSFLAAGHSSKGDIVSLDDGIIVGKYQYRSSTSSSDYHNVIFTYDPSTGLISEFPLTSSDYRGRSVHTDLLYDTYTQVSNIN